MRSYTPNDKAGHFLTLNGGYSRNGSPSNKPIPWKRWDWVSVILVSAIVLFACVCAFRVINLISKASAEIDQIAAQGVQEVPRITAYLGDPYSDIRYHAIQAIMTIEELDGLGNNAKKRAEALEAKNVPLSSHELESLMSNLNSVIFDLKAGDRLNKLAFEAKSMICGKEFREKHFSFR